jgi:putative RecB family exonuclease
MGHMTAEPLPLEGLPAPLLAAYPSRLTTWLDCPRRYRMAYLDRPGPPKGPPWAHNSYGSTIHNALRAWTTAPVAERTPENARRLVGSHWLSDGYRDDEQQATFRARAADAVERYVTTLDPTAEPVGVERTVSARLPGLALSGRVDRIDRRDDELVVVDYKTGRRVPSADEVRGSVQLALYAVATAATLKKPCLTVELHHVPSGEVVAHRHTPESLGRHVDRAVAVAAEVRSAVDHPAVPGPLCRWCDYVRSCPEGATQVVDLPLPWAGLDDG